MINNSRGSCGMENTLCEGINAFLSTFPSKQSNLEFSIALYNRDISWLRLHDVQTNQIQPHEITISDKQSSMYDSIHKVIKEISEDSTSSSTSTSKSKTYLIVQVDADDHSSNMTARQIKKELARKRKEGWECIILTADKLRLPLGVRLGCSENMLPYVSTNASKAFKTAAVAIKGQRSSFKEEEIARNLSNSPPGILYV